MVRSDRRMEARLLARIIHKLPAAEPPSLALAALPPLGLLGIVHDYACGALARKALPARTLRTLRFGTL